MAITDQERARRAAFGRGLVEGLRMAGVENPEEHMNINRLHQKLESASGLERKVFQAVPISTPWDAAAIARELLRTSVSAPVNHVAGCLGKLVQMKLVREPVRGQFIRCQIKPEKDTPINHKDHKADMSKESRESSEAAPAAAEATDCVTRLANIAVLLRRAADEAEAVALDFDEEKRDLTRDGERLRQLQALLKGLGA